MNAPSAGLSRWRATMIVGVVLALHATVSPAAPVTGADVDESRVQNVYHVDLANADAANDAKHGTADAPFATIGYACEVALRDKDRHLGVKVIIEPGVYREAIEIDAPANGATDSEAPLIIESAERAQAVIDGADTDGWTASTWKQVGTQWVHAFKSNVTRHPSHVSGETLRTGTLIALDGNILRQVNRLEDLVPGCFWEGAALASHKPPSEGPAIYLQPPPDTLREGSVIQVGTRHRGLAIHGRRNIVIRGILFQHAASPAGLDQPAAGLSLDGCSNVLIDDVVSQWNDGDGLVIAGRAGSPADAGFTLRQVHLLHNGRAGLMANDIQNLLVEDTEACFNNFRGEWANQIDVADVAGVRAIGVQGSSWQRLRAIGNFCRGVSWQGNNADVTMEGAELRTNVINGLFIEDNPGPVLVRGCLIAETKSHPGIRPEGSSVAGIVLRTTPDVTLESNIVVANASVQISLGEEAVDTGGKKNRVLKKTRRSQRCTYQHNVFFGRDASQSLCSVPVIDEDDTSGLAAYLPLVETGENCFWNPAQADAFSLRGHPSKPAMNLETLRTLLRAKTPAANDRAAEAGSFWKDPLFADSKEGDYRLRERSPVIEWGLPSEEGAETP